MMFTSTHPIIILSDSDIKDAFSSTHYPDYILASPDYFSASPGNTSSDPSEGLSKYLLASLAILPFYNDLYIKVMHKYNATSNESLIPPQAPIAPPTVLPSSLAAIRKLVADSVAAALEAQAATMANTDNTNRNTKQSETHVARKCSYKDFMICQPFNFKVEAYKITWFEFNKLLIKKYCPRTEELAILCPTMVPNYKKLMEVFIGGLPKSIERNVTASKPQTLEEAIIITQRLMDQHQHHNRRQETFRSYAATLTENNRNCKNKGLATGINLKPVLVTCHAYGEKGNFKSQFSKANNSAHGRAYLLRDKNAHQNPNVVMDTTYDIKMADGNLVGTNSVIQGCTLILLNQPFKIDLMPIKLDSFDVIIAQTEAIKEENIEAKNLRGMDKAFEVCPDETRCIQNRIWLPLFGDLRDLIMHESYKLKYSIHPGSNKM
nr:reverse transcriptase domain-containing protein [Tanacetum cinerariifolium]